MAQLALNKSSLLSETKRLKTYRTFLPSLEMKRKQIIAERNKARRALAKTEAAAEEALDYAQQELPMLAGGSNLLSGLLTLESAERGVENIVGTKLPTLGEVRFNLREYPLTGSPAWLDQAVDLLRRYLELILRLEVERERVRLLDAALRKTTQRVNLFDKVLIPRAQTNIRRIKIYLSDMERAAVVRAKIAKGKHDDPHQEANR